MLETRPRPSPCCCTNDGDGHRCPDAWFFILKAQILALTPGAPGLWATRQAYTQHLVEASLTPPGSDAWPDRCTITIDADPRCPQCHRTGEDTP